MAFSSRRGRPRQVREQRDHGTPELQRKLASGLTHEPIDRCLGSGLITPGQHRSGLHLRWLYTVRYGAPCVTTQYPAGCLPGTTATQSEEWRGMREHEYREATHLLRLHRRYDAVMRLVVHNEVPVFLCAALQRRAWHDAAMAEQLSGALARVREGLELLGQHWRAQYATAAQRAHDDCNPCATDR